MFSPLVIDNFAGGGGASTGIEAALGRSIDVAINHDEAAVAVHTANHPNTKHYCQSIYSVDPLDATQGRPVLLIWFSPDCKHHSKAKGGKPREKYIRDMAHVVPHWIERLQKATPGGEGAPLVIMLENVEEFREWGPLDEEGRPIKERKGEEFQLWVRRIRRCAHMAQHNAGNGCAQKAADEPLSTITGRGTQQQLVQTTLIEAGTLPPARMDRAVQVAAFLVKYYGSEVGQHQGVDRPFDTVTAKPRFAVVTVTIDAVTYVIVDIGMRMLMPRELANAQGFPADYVLDPVCWYKTDSGARKHGRLPKSQQIAKIGNAVCPPMAEVLVRANLPEHCAGRLAA